MASSNTVPRRLAIVVGDTAGHVYPALAIADAWRASAAAVDILLIGAADSTTSALAASEGFRVSAVDARPIVRAGIVERARAVALVATTVRQARRILHAHGARLVIGLGAFPSGGVLLAARSLGLRTAIHESNVEPGMANRLLGPLVDRIYLGFPAAGRAFSRRRQVVTGNAIRASIAALASAPRAPMTADRVARILVTSGSRGGEFLAAVTPDVLRIVAAHGVRLEVRHQTGGADTPSVQASYEARGIRAVAQPFVHDMAGEYRWADFVIARAGGGTLAEIAMAGLPALLVPLADAAGDHQAANARTFAESGAALWAGEHDWDAPTIATRIGDLLRDTARWTHMSAAARGLARPGAAQRIVEDGERLMAGRW